MCRMRKTDRAWFETKHMDAEHRAKYLAQHGARSEASAKYQAELLEKKTIRKEA